MGAGLGLALQHKAQQGGEKNVAVALYGDGAANQGQVSSRQPRTHVKVIVFVGFRGLQYR